MIAHFRQIQSRRGSQQLQILPHTNKPLESIRIAHSFEKTPLRPKIGSTQNVLSTLLLTDS